MLSRFVAELDPADEKLLAELMQAGPRAEQPDELHRPDGATT